MLNTECIEDIERIEPNVKGDEMISLDHRWGDK